jgi:hypothetical protein
VQSSRLVKPLGVTNFAEGIESPRTSSWVALDYAALESALGLWSCTVALQGGLQAFSLLMGALPFYGAHLLHLL